MERYQEGLKNLETIDGQAGEEVVARVAKMSPDFARYLVEYPFGDIYARPGLNLRERELITVAALGAMGNAAPQLKVHVKASRNVGISFDALKEVAMQLSVYAGFPAALNTLFAIDEIEQQEKAEQSA